VDLNSLPLSSIKFLYFFTSSVKETWVKRVESKREGSKEREREIGRDLYISVTSVFVLFHKEQIISLLILVPFKSVALSSRHLDGSHEVAYESGETILFDEGEIRAFTCQAFGGYPQPDVSVLLGDKDISSQFNKTTKLTKDGVPGLYALTYDVELKNSLLEITYEYSKKKLECKASIPSAGFLNSTYINVELSGCKFVGAVFEGTDFNNFSKRLFCSFLLCST